MLVFATRASVCYKCKQDVTVPCSLLCPASHAALFLAVPCMCCRLTAVCQRLQDSRQLVWRGDRRPVQRTRTRQRTTAGWSSGGGRSSSSWRRCLIRCSWMPPWTTTCSSSCRTWLKQLRVHLAAAAAQQATQQAQAYSSCTRGRWPWSPLALSSASRCPGSSATGAAHAQHMLGHVRRSSRCPSACICCSTGAILSLQHALCMCGGRECCTILHMSFSIMLALLRLSFDKNTCVALQVLRQALQPRLL